MLGGIFGRRMEMEEKVKKSPARKRKINSERDARSTWLAFTAHNLGQRVYIKSTVENGSEHGNDLHLITNRSEISDEQQTSCSTEQGTSEKMIIDAHFQ